VGRKQQAAVRRSEVRQALWDNFYRKRQVGFFKFLSRKISPGF
jgi:hypothetical protein